MSNLLIGNPEADPGCLLTDESLIYQALQGPLLDLECLDEILIPVLFILLL